jgi:hypothetical protein
MKNTTLLNLLFICFSTALHAQHVTISGYVSEEESAERMIGAVVFLPDKNIGTTTNAYGFYSITVPTSGSSIQLRVSYIGYEPYTVSITPDKNISLDIQLDKSTNLKEVVVTSQKDAIQTRTQMSSIDLPIETIKSLPAFLGEVDIMKAIQLLPGIQAGTEGSSGIYVRGGGPDQNLILLDGVPVYNASHLFGFFSVFNADAIKNVEVIKGGFPARYGGRLSSVIDISMKEGDKNQIHGEGGIGIIASRLTLEGPIQKGKSSFMISGRRTYIDILAKPLLDNEDGNVGYYFYDLNGKANFKITDKDHIYFSGYFGNDKFYAKDKGGDNLYNYNSNTGLQWGNITAVGRWNHQFSPKLFGNLTSYYTRYRFLISSLESSTNFGQQEKYLLKYFSGINDVAVKYDFDYLPGPNHFIKTGIAAISHTYTPGALQSKVSSTFENVDTTVGNAKTYATEIDAYAEDDIRITSKLKTNIGVHWTGFEVRGKFFNAIQPRVALRYLINDAFSAKASYVQMNQFIHLLTNSSVGLPTDLWVPVTDKVPTQLAHQVAAGVAYTHNTGIEVSVEGYYKLMKNVIEYKEGASFFNTTSNWEDKIEIGKGSSYGAELFLQKKKGRLTGMLGYTLSWTTRQFNNLNMGEEFPYRYDRRHDIKIAAVYHLSKSIELSADWVYGTGVAITMPLGIAPDEQGNPLEVYGKRNDYRMPAYHRGDVSMRFIRERRRSQRAWIISVYNVYNHYNAFYIERDYDSFGYTKFTQVTLFPIIPSISYQFKF